MKFTSFFQIILYHSNLWAHFPPPVEHFSTAAKCFLAPKNKSLTMNTKKGQFKKFIYFTKKNVMGKL